MTIVHGVVFDCASAATLAAFWKEALGWEYRSQRPAEGWITIQPIGGNEAMSIGFGEVPEGKSVKNRVHLDLRPSPGTGWQEERLRLEALGALTLQTFDDAHYVLADPEGNEFCLLNPKWYE